jgi:diguanylate cyclase (GGDEF)-like protein
LNWNGIPDLAAIALLICAFASVERHSKSSVSGIWLTAWVMVALHFIAFLFLPAPGAWGTAALLVGLVALAWAGTLFMYAAVPHRQQHHYPLVAGLLLLANTLYICLILAGPYALWALTPAAAFFGAYSLLLTVLSLRQFHHPLRWTMAFLYASLSVFLLIFQHRPGNGSDLALNAILFTVFLGCTIHFLFTYRRATTGSFVTITGFLAWASVFVVAPMMRAFEPQVHIESEVWNLPKFVVAAGMMLLLLEDQIEHNQHLALHDVLTGLPNRRLFEDRMASALERCRRNGAEMAVLVIDLDGFKQVNDTLGHHVGDLALQHVALAFAERVRRSDTVSRTGGDEFSVILEEPANRADAEHVGRSLRQLLHDPLDLDGHCVRLSASVGIAIFPEDASDAESLCIAADLRMYDAKNYAERSKRNEVSATLKSLSAQESEVNETPRLAQ